MGFRKIWSILRNDPDHSILVRAFGAIIPSKQFFRFCNGDHYTINKKPTESPAHFFAQFSCVDRSYHVHDRFIANILGKL